METLGSLFFILKKLNFCFEKFFLDNFAEKMKRILALIAILILSFQINFAQKITGYILNSKTGKPVCFATINDMTNNTTYFSGFNGYFEIHNSASAQIFLKISHPAYNSKQEKLFNNSENNKIYIDESENYDSEIIQSISRIEIPKSRTAYQIENMSKTDLKFSTNNIIDDYFRNLSNINLINAQGIYTSNPIVNISGMGNLQGKTAVLINGTPINSFTDGSINWNMLSSNFFSEIEILNTPFTSFYGTNAISGTINLFTQKPVEEGFHGKIELNGGQYFTVGTHLNLMYKHKHPEGIYALFDGNIQRSTGYIQTPANFQDTTHFKYPASSFLHLSALLSLGYDFSNNTSIKIEQITYKGLDNTGLKAINSANDNNNTFSYLSMLNFNTKRRNTAVNLNISLLNESNSTKNLLYKNSDYLIFNNSSRTQNFSSNVNINQQIGKIYTLTIGGSFNYGIYTDIDDFSASTDQLQNSGVKKSADFYVQNTFSLLKNNKLNLLISGNKGFYKYQNLNFEILNPTSSTDFLNYYKGIKNTDIKNNLSYNAAIKWNISSKIAVGASYNYGENSPNTDNFAKIQYSAFGLKIANFNLKPEKIGNYNAFAEYKSNSLTLNISENYSIGQNFIYLTQTGDTSSNGLMILQMNNAANVKVNNFNAQLNYNLKHFQFFVNYTYNKAQFTSFDKNNALISKVLPFTPIYATHFGITANYMNMWLSFAGHYTSEQFTDNLNKNIIPAIYNFDVLLKVSLTKKFSTNFSILNVLNNPQTINKKTSLGRSIMFSIKYNF